MIEEALAAHVSSHAVTLTSGGSRLAYQLGWCELSVFGLAREGGQTSSFNFAGGTADALHEAPELFGVDRMMRELTQQVHTQPLAERFTGDVVLAPGAVEGSIRTSSSMVSRTARAKASAARPAIFGQLRESGFAASEWRLRASAAHLKSQTYAR